MFRYMAMFWEPGDTESAHRSRAMLRALRHPSARWSDSLLAPGCHVLHSGETPQLHATKLEAATGVILGSCFIRPCPDSDAPPPPLIPTAANSRAIIESHGTWLVNHTWGDYVALLRLPDAIVTLLSPTGALPCLHLCHRGLAQVFSHLGDLSGLDVPVLRPTHAYVRDRVMGRPIGALAPLGGLTRLHRGESLRISFRNQQSLQRNVAWRPLEIVKREGPIDDPAHAAPIMRNTLRACTRALAADHSQVLLRLSGGLDSSIIAGCLKDLPHTTVTAHTYWPQGTPGDVRPWARRAAQHGHFPLIETAVDPGPIHLATLAQLQPSADVIARLEYTGRPALERDLCDRTGASAVFTGDGGDSGFCGDSIALVVLEYLKRRGLRPSVLPLAAQAARYTHRSTWQELQRALRRWHRGGTWAERQPTRAAVTQLVARELQDRVQHDRCYDHPWFASERDIPWAVIARLGLLVTPPTFYDFSVAPESFAPTILQPLYAQPVVETLLRIPLDLHFEGGRERGLARRAFAGDAPAENLQRLWKDRAPRVFAAIMERHREWLREMFLDGILVRDRLLDRAAVQRAFSTEPARATPNSGEILRHLDTELWARQWSG